MNSTKLNKYLQPTLGLLCQSLFTNINFSKFPICKLYFLKLVNISTKEKSLI